MAKFGSKSLLRLATCHPDLQRLFKRVVQTYDCTVLEGHRNKPRQDKMLELGRSKLRWPRSKHNSLPSEAVDVMPWFMTKPHVDWEDREAIAKFAGYVLATAEEMGIKIRWGGDWDNDNRVGDERFSDMPHFEILL